MPQRAATIESLPEAFAVVKAMQADGLDWDEGYRPQGRQALAEIIEGRMAEDVDRWRDGVVLGRRTGAGAPKRPVPVALGLRHDGKKEVIDFQLARAESAAEWERFLTSLWRRGLTGEGLEMICADGGKGLLAVLPTVYPDIPVRRCWAHKVRNILDKVREADREAVKRDLHAVMNAPNRPKALTAASPRAGPTDTPRRSPACASTSTTYSPACATGTSPNASRCGPPTPSNGGSGRCGGEPDPWGPSRTAPPWTASSSPSSLMKTSAREPAPLSP